MFDARYTDEPPPREVLDDVPNWVYARGEEGRRGQDETTIKPHKMQKRIDDDTDYTAAQIRLVDGTKLVGLLRLSWGRVKGITIYQESELWRAEVGNVGEIPVETLPLEYRSRLRYDGDHLHGTIAADGKWSRIEPKR